MGHREVLLLDVEATPRYFGSSGSPDSEIKVSPAAAKDPFGSRIRKFRPESTCQRGKNMRRHHRALLVQKAEGIFGIIWVEALEQMNISSYEDSYLIWNQIDRFWIDSARQGLSPEDACSAWERVDTSIFIFPSVAHLIGNKLIQVVREHGLTYGEINSVLLSPRSLDTRNHIRTERHPDTPEKPGGLA